MSDAVPNSAIPTWEEWTEDIGAVLDAVDSTKTAIMAMIDAGPISVLYSVAHPERVDALVLLNTAAKYLAGNDYAFGASPEAVDALVHLMGTQYGTPEYVKLTNPGIDDDRCDLVARTLRSSNTPRTAAAQYDYVLRSVDVRQVLSLIRAPTLVFAGNGLPLLPIDHGRYLADHIEGAKFVELDSGDFNPANQPEMFFEELAEFLTGTRPIAETDRVLASVLFTDIVRSTERAASVGDQRWRAVLDHHDAVVREQLRIFRGREVNTTGDGFVASFDGPARAIRCGQAIIGPTKALGIDLHVGLHAGECEARGDDLGGLAVHIAARVNALAAAGEVLVSSTVRDLVVGSGIEFEDRGKHELKGVPGSWKLFAVAG